MMTHASVFSGIGGAELASAWMGWTNLFHCEIQEFPRQVLEYWFPNSESYGDITTTNFENGRERSMFSQVDFPVSLSQSQVVEKEKKMTVISGQKCFEQFERYSQLGSLLKTLMESERWWNPVVKLRWDVQTISSRKVIFTEKNINLPSSESARILSEKDILSNRLLYQLVPSEHPTGEIGSGLLPTPLTQGLKRCGKTGKTEFFPLKLLPTPMTAEADKYTKKFNPKSQMGQSLTALAVNGMLPKRSEKDLEAAAMHSKGSQNLNPLYVEEMMGFPLMWTTLPFLKEGGERNP